MTQAYLPALMIVVAVVGLVLIVAGAIRGGKSREEEAGKNSTVPAATLPADEAAALAEGHRIMDTAALRAAQYDYDGAIALLNSFTGDPSTIAGMSEALADYEAAKSSLVAWPDNATIPHLSFQPLVADTDRAFDSDENESTYKSYNFTVAQFSEILQQLYDNGYVLVSMHDVALPITDAEGKTTYEPVSISLPEGKKPLLLSQVPVNYYLGTVDGDGDKIPDAKGDGFACRLTLDAAGNVTSEMVNAQGETVQGLFDIVPVLNAFIQQNPGFSYHGAKAVLGVTGYDGVFGYRNPEDHAAAQAVAQALISDGYSFACFSYGSIAYGAASTNEVYEDIQKWKDEVVPIIGETDTLFFVSGSDIAETSQSYTGEKFDALYNAGFRYFVGMGSSVWADFRDTYVRQSRTTINPAKLMEAPATFNMYFTSSEITALR